MSQIPHETGAQPHSPADASSHPSPVGKWTIIRSESERLPVFAPQENKFCQLFLHLPEAGVGRCEPSYPRGHQQRLKDRFAVQVLDGRFQSEEFEDSEGRKCRLVGLTFRLPGNPGTYLSGALLTRPKTGSDAPSSVDPWVARDEGSGRGPAGPPAAGRDGSSVPPE